MSEIGKLPRHVAIIMDGNGRWAKAHALQVSAGHRRGTETLRAVIRESSDIGIEALTLFAFSTENWKRSAAEVKALMALLLEYFTSEIDELHANNVCIRILGDQEGLPAPQRDAVRAAEERTRANTGLKLNIALNYGGRDELLRAARLLASQVERGEKHADQITREDLEAALYTHDLPDVDLLVRTSGEMRQSNFLLYQCAYAEMVFPSVLWPDFTLADYHAALAAYGMRDRRFGGRSE